MSWVIDSAHSQVQFSVRHMMISNVRGRFENFTGSVEFNEERPELSSVRVEIEAASINTREAKRDDHLRSPDFLNAAEFPLITFKSKRTQMVDQAHGKVYGDLTIRGVTRQVVLDVEYAGQSKMWGNTSAGFSAETRINRKDWGLTWNMAVETGGVLVGDEIKISVELEIVKQAEGVKAEAA